MESKKISFGFSKSTKKPNLLPIKATKPEIQVELIKCLEGQEIKLVEERKEAAPIVIPMKENGKTSAALASLMRRRAVLLGEDEEAVPNELEAKSKSKDIEIVDNALNDDLEKRAAREILADLQKNNETVHDNGLVLPILKPDELPLDGAKESNMDDYESIPIEQYGMAMLRGMGWVEPPPSKQKKPADDAPMVRPKGMGLGADKALKAKPLLIQPEANETLEIKKQAYVRILGGKYKDAYGQIEGFDDEAGRVIVKLAIGGTREAFNEFLCQPVSKKEFSQYGKCINTAKYEEYKKLENEHGQIIVKKEEPKFEREEKKNVKSEMEMKYKSIPSSGNYDSITKKEETKLEREDKKLVRREFDTKYKSTASSDNYDSNEKTFSRQRYDEYPASSSNRGRSRSRSRSDSRSRKYTSSRRYDDETYSDDNSGSSTDSAYEQQHKHHTKSKYKSKSHARKVKSSKKKSRRRRGSSDSNSRKTHSSYSDETDNERHYQRHHHSNKKNKKKTKKSKKQRSRTPSRHRK